MGDRKAGVKIEEMITHFGERKTLTFLRDHGGKRLPGVRAHLTYKLKKAIVDEWMRGASYEELAGRFSQSVDFVRAAVDAHSIKMRKRRIESDSPRPLVAMVSDDEVDDG